MRSRTVENDDDEVIDTDEIFFEEIPAELLERVSEHHPHLVEVSLQVRRGRWQTLRQGRRMWTTSPPDTPPHDICLFLVRTARLDVERNGEAQRYRARLRCKLNGHEYSRFASVRGQLSDDGSFTIVDDDVAVCEDSPEHSKLLLEMARQANEHSFACMSRCVNMLDGYARMGELFEQVLDRAAQVFTQNVSGQAELLRIQLEMERNRQEHEASMRKFEQGISLIGKPVARLGDEIATLVGEAINDSKRKRAERASSDSGRPQPGRRPSPRGPAHTPPRPAGPRASPGAAPTTVHASAPANDAPPPTARTGAPSSEPVSNVQAVVQTPANEAPPASFAVQLDAIVGGLPDEARKRADDVMSERERELLDEARRVGDDAAFRAVFGAFVAEVKARGDQGSTAWVHAMAGAVGVDALQALAQLMQVVERP